MIFIIFIGRYSAFERVTLFYSSAVYTAVIYHKHVAEQKNNVNKNPIGMKTLSKEKS